MQVGPLYTSLILFYLAILLSRSGKGSPLKYLVSFPAMI